MLKLLLILLVLLLIFLMLSSYILTGLRRIFNPQSNSGNKVQKDNSEVIYDKNGVTVMKGEAKEKKD